MTRETLQVGRQKFVAHQNTMADTRKLLQDAANDRRADRTPEPLVIRPLVVAVNPETQEQRVISELRREYWPGTSPAFVAADKAARMGEQSLGAALRTVGLVGAIKGRLGRLFRNA